MYIASMGDDEIKHITIGDHDYSAVRITNGGLGYIELRDPGTGVPVGRVTHHGPDEEMELTTFGATLPRSAIEWMLTMADAALA